MKYLNNYSFYVSAEELKNEGQSDLFSSVYEVLNFDLALKKYVELGAKQKVLGVIVGGGTPIDLVTFDAIAIRNPKNESKLLCGQAQENFWQNENPMNRIMLMKFSNELNAKEEMPQRKVFEKMKTNEMQEISAERKGGDFLSESKKTAMSKY